MKRFITVCCCIIFLLCGCDADDIVRRNSQNAQTPAREGKIKIVATIFPLYDFARAVAGDKADIEMLVSPGAEVHSYEPTAKNIISIRESDLFINVGGNADPWTQKVLEASGDTYIETLSAAEHVDLKTEKTVEGMELDHDHDDDDDHDHMDINNADFDEHVWTSLENAEEITEEICETLSRIDPQNASYYKRNAEKYCSELEKLDDRFEKLTDRAKRRTIVFADRFPFRYLADDYDLRYYAAFPGCSSESEPSAATVSFLIKKVKQENIPVVFYTETSNGKVADTICEATGAKKLMMHSCHNVTKEQLESGVTYLKLMTDNYEALSEALN